MATKKKATARNSTLPRCALHSQSMQLSFSCSKHSDALVKVNAICIYIERTVSTTKTTGTCLPGSAMKFVVDSLETFKIALSWTTLHLVADRANSHEAQVTLWRAGCLFFQQAQENRSSSHWVCSF